MYGTSVYVSGWAYSCVITLYRCTVVLMILYAANSHIKHLSTEKLLLDDKKFPEFKKMLADISTY